MVTQPRIRNAGKQVLLDGRHLADAVTEEAAEVIGIALNSVTIRGLLPAERRKVEGLLR